MIPVVFQLGPLPIHSFGLMMLLCFVAAYRRLSLSLGRAENGQSLRSDDSPGQLSGAFSVLASIT